MQILLSHPLRKPFLHLVVHFKQTLLKIVPLRQISPKITQLKQVFLKAQIQQVSYKCLMMKLTVTKILQMLYSKLEKH